MVVGHFLGKKTEAGSQQLGRVPEFTHIGPRCAHSSGGLTWVAPVLRGCIQAQLPGAAASQAPPHPQATELGASALPSRPSTWYPGRKVGSKVEGQQGRSQALHPYLGPQWQWNEGTFWGKRCPVPWVVLRGEGTLVQTLSVHLGAMCDCVSYCRLKTNHLRPGGSAAKVGHGQGGGGESSAGTGVRRGHSMRVRAAGMGGALGPPGY